MPYDFRDPNQINEFRAKAKEAGKSYGETEAYINNKLTRSMGERRLALDIGKQELAEAKLGQDILELQGGSTKEAPAGEVAKLADFDSATEMMSGISDLLQEKEGSFGPVMGRLSVLSPWASDPRATRAQLKMASQVVGRALEGGVLRKEDEIKYEKMLPQLSDTPELARSKIEDVMNLLQTQRSTRSEQLSQVGYKVPGGYEEPGLGLGEQPTDQPGLEPAEKQPAINVKGEIAQPGDLIRNNETGDLSIFGKPEDLKKAKLFKKTTSGGDVENSFIEWLASSEFLPIAGSVVGSIAGAGLASIGTGAAGAVAGKAMQQGLRELLDPEAQDLSDMAQAVVIEGTVDALLGGAMFGVGKYVLKPIGKGIVAKTGLRFMIGEGAEQALKEAGEEAVEATGKKGFLKKRAEGLTKKGLGLKTSDISKFKKYQKGSLVSEVTEKGYKSVADAAKRSQEEGMKAVKKLSGMLKGKSADTGDVIKILEDAKAGAMTPQGVVKEGYQAGINKLDGYIEEIASYGDDISVPELNKIKGRMQKSFGKSLEVTTEAKGLVAETSTKVKKFIEQYHDDIVGTNREIRFNKLVNDAAVSKLDNPKLESLLKFNDLIVGTVSTPALLAKKSVDLFARQFDELAQARILNNGLQMAVADGNRMGIRNILRFANGLGINWSATGRGARGAVAGSGASSVAESGQPGLDLQPTQETQQQPGFMYR